MWFAYVFNMYGVSRCSGDLNYFIGAQAALPEKKDCLELIINWPTSLLIRGCGRRGSGGGYRAVKPTHIHLLTVSTCLIK